MKRNDCQLCYLLLLSIAFLLSSCYSGRVPSEGGDQSFAPKANTVERDQQMDNANTTIADMLRRVPGVLVAGDNSITIRGMSSLTLSNEPLFVIDGTPVGSGYSAVSGMNPMDIDRITVLKGAQASIYGARGANGVIVIKTKN